MQLALYTSRSSWMEPVEISSDQLGLAGCMWYKEESSGLVHTSHLDVDKGGCVIQIHVD